MFSLIDTKPRVEIQEAEYQRLRQALQSSFDQSNLPEGATARNALNELLVRLRMPRGRKVSRD